MSRTLRTTAAALALGGSLVLASAAVTALAQNSPFGRSDTMDFDNEDLAAINGAASKIGQPNSKVGQTENWQNPKTGRSGSISLLQTFERYGLPCQKRRYTVDSTVKNPGSSYVMDFCRLPSGEWKTA
jgi:surface antigen